MEKLWLGTQRWCYFSSGCRRVTKVRVKFGIVLAAAGEYLLILTLKRGNKMFAAVLPDAPVLWSCLLLLLEAAHPPPHRAPSLLPLPELREQPASPPPKFERPIQPRSLESTNLQKVEFIYCVKSTPGTAVSNAVKPWGLHRRP